LRLRVLARYGVGLDNADVDYAVSRGIAVVNAPTASSQSVAELTIGLIIVALRSLHLHIDSVKRMAKSRDPCAGYKRELWALGWRIARRVEGYLKATGWRLDEVLRLAATANISTQVS